MDVGSGAAKKPEKVPPSNFAQWLGYKPPAGPVTKYLITRADLYPRWHGTVLSQVWQSVLGFMFLSFIFFVIYATYSHDGTMVMDVECDDDGTKCRPEWFDEHLSSITHVARDLTSLSTFVLTFYLGYSYARYIDYYWACRAVQGRINDLALIVGANINFSKMENDPDLDDWAVTFERYLNLVHFLCHAKTSPVLQNKKILTDPQGTGSVLLNETILGMQLCTEEEYGALLRAKDIGGPNGPGNTVLVWLTMLYDKGVNMDRAYFRDNTDAARMTALNMAFQDKIEALRGAIAHIGFELQLPVPLAYAHMMQFFVDTICVLYPFVAVYEVNTVIIKSTGYTEMDLWASLPFTLLGVFFFSFFYQGLLALSKTFAAPAGRSVDPKNPATEVLDKEFYIEVRTILNQTKGGTYMFFNTGKMAPKVLRPNSVKLRAGSEAVAEKLEEEAKGAEEPSDK
jgi:hypothetical protein